MASTLRTALMGSLFFAGLAPVPSLAFAQTAQTGGVAVSEVVVTAEKRTQKVIDVPASVSVIGGGQLERLQSNQMSDWAGYVPGLDLGFNGAPGETNLSLDGVGPIGAASEVGVYVNDTPVGSSSSFQGGNGFSLDLMPYDLNRVEVLRGPQGTLYGASTMGGLIKYVLATPNLEQFSGKIGGDLFGVQNGDGAGGGARAEVNLPIAPGTLGVRIAAYDQNTPGYIDDITTGQKADNALRQQGGRIAAEWKPTSDITIDLSALYQKSHADNQAFVALNQATGQPFGDSLSNINSRAEPYTQELQLYDATINWDLHWAEVTSTTSYQDFKNHTVEDVSAYIGQYLGFYGAPGPEPADFDENYRLQKFSQEVRLASPTGQTLEWQIGGFYTHETGANDEQFTAYDSTTGGQLAGFNPLERVTLPSTYEEYAVFGDATYHFTNWFDLSAGMRYAHNQQSFVESEGGFLVNSAAPTVPALIVPGSSSEGVTTFSVSPRIHLSHDTMVYARVASGYQPGGPNVILPGTVGLPAQFTSSDLIDYQLGLKSTFLDGKATADLSLFYIDWTKIQVSVFNGASSAIENAGKAKSEGVDFSGTYSPLSGLVLGGNLAYTDAYLTSAVPSISVTSGAELPYVPMWAGSVTAEYSRPLAADWRGFVGGGYRYIGARNSAVEGSMAGGLPQGIVARAYQVVDLHLGVTGRGYTVSLFAKNLTDDRAYLAPADYFNDAIGAPIDIKAPVLQPRTIGVSVDKSF